MEIDPDAKTDAFACWGISVALDHSPLHLDSTAHRFDRARELHEHAVSRRLQDPTAIFGDLWLVELLAVGLQAFKHAFPTRPYQTCITYPIPDEAAGSSQDQRTLVTYLKQMRVTDHIDSEDRSETASSCSHFQASRTPLDGAPSRGDVFDRIFTRPPGARSSPIASPHGSLPDCKGASAALS